MEALRIVEEGTAGLEAYASIPIAFTVTSRLDLEELIRSKGHNLIEKPTAPREKDYDASPEDHPTAHPTRFDVRHWSVLAAYLGPHRVGGAILAWRSPGFDMLYGRDDLAVIVDFRIHPSARGQGVGRKLFDAAAEWARRRGCIELDVETQDTNVAACRFYRAMGCELHSADPHGYGPEIDEAKLVWRLSLSGLPSRGTGTPAGDPLSE